MQWDIRMRIWGQWQSHISRILDQCSPPQSQDHNRVPPEFGNQEGGKVCSYMPIHLTVLLIPWMHSSYKLYLLESWLIGLSNDITHNTNQYY